MDMQVLRYSTIDSTNSECFRLYEAKETRGLGMPFCVIADVQTHGRGQFNRQWFSADSENLYISICFEPRYSVIEFNNFSTVLAYQIQKQIAEKWKLAVDVKSPNDLYFAGKKFGGILTESKIIGDKIAYAVTGVGININSDISKFPQELQSISTSLKAASGRYISKEIVVKIVIDSVNYLLEEN